MAWYACTCGLIWDVVDTTDGTVFCPKCSEKGVIKDGFMLPGNLLMEMLER